MWVLGAGILQTPGNSPIQPGWRAPGLMPSFQDSHPLLHLRRTSRSEPFSHTWPLPKSLSLMQTTLPSPPRRGREPAGVHPQSTEQGWECGGAPSGCEPQSTGSVWVGWEEEPGGTCSRFLGSLPTAVWTAPASPTNDDGMLAENMGP